MAVVQISRIQVRRGQKNQGSGLPQLASGEIGWAIDTRELYIGNGAVSEGAPAVGNTKILTQYDDIFNLADTYTYRTDDNYIQTGASSASPIQRSLQKRLDDIVSVRSFGLTGETSQNATEGLQRAIDQLFLNTATKGSEQSRITLNLEAGIYVLDGPVYLPPNSTLVGAGPEKTVIRQTTANSIFITVNDSSTPGNPANDSSSTFNNQARNIQLKGMTLQNTSTGKGLWLQSCRDSEFYDVDVVGSWESGDTIPTDYSTDIGIELDSLSGSVESSNNTFRNVRVSNFGYGVMSNWDVDKNVFDRCTFETLGHGIVFGVDMVLGDSSQGRSTGPVNNIISHSNFKDINRHGIWIEQGKFNSSQNNTFESVGNEGGTEGQPEYSVINYNKATNETVNDYFSRTYNLSYNQEFINNVPYIPEVEGSVSYVNNFEQIVSIQQGTGVKLFRLPAIKNQSFELDYLIVSRNYEVIRSGTLTLTVDAYGTTGVQVSDEYTFNGNNTYLEDIVFSADILDEDGDLTDETISVKVTSTMPGDDSTQMKFKIKNKKTDIV